METVTQRIEKKILINAQPDTVWFILTNLEKMKDWMGEPEMKLDVVTDWAIGAPILIKGYHHVAFENKGTVLKFDPPCWLTYTYLSSLSRLADLPRNYSVIEFHLTPMAEETQLTLHLSNFPTEAIFKHVEFYWTTTLQILKELAEQKQNIRK